MYGPNYGNDRAEIEDLMARYLFAFDWQDPEAYAGTFTEDGVLDFAGGVKVGREALKAEMVAFGERERAKAAASFPPRRHRVRHFVDNLVLEIDGDAVASTPDYPDEAAREQALQRLRLALDQLAAQE